MGSIFVLFWCGCREIEDKTAKIVNTTHMNGYTGVTEAAKWKEMKRGREGHKSLI